MTASEALAVHERVQQAYASQLAELAGAQPDLDRCVQLASDIDAELATLPPPAQLSGLDDRAREALLTTTRKTAELLAQGRAALLARRAQLLDDQARSERSDGALRAYQIPENPPDAHFLDERH